MRQLFKDVFGIYRDTNVARVIFLSRVSSDARFVWRVLDALPTFLIVLTLAILDTPLWLVIMANVTMILGFGIIWRQQEKLITWWRLEEPLARQRLWEQQWKEQVDREV